MHMTEYRGMHCGRRCDCMVFAVSCRKQSRAFAWKSYACVRIGNEVSEWLAVNVGVRQGCVMSPWFI